jgi:hypothetical protein
LSLARQAVELLEDLAKMLGRHARPSIGNLDDDGAIFIARGELERATWRRVLVSVLEQVDEYLFNENRVDRDKREVLRESDVDPPIVEHLFHAVQYGTHDLLERLPLLGDLHRAGSDLGHVQEILNEPIESLRFLVNRFAPANLPLQ